MTEINNQEPIYKKPKTGTIIGGVVVGSIIQNVVAAPKNIIASQCMSEMRKLSKALTEDEFKLVEKATKETIENSGLSQKGVSIIKATAENTNEINNIMIEEMQKNIVLKFLPEKVNKFIGKIFGSIIKSGENAIYAMKANKILLPEKELSLAFFHEAGHAANANLSTVGKILQKSRMAAILAIPISLIALWKTKKAPGKEPKSGIDKTTTFIKENAGKLTFATVIPILIEEALATAKGNNFAKKLLNPELAKKVSKSNALGFTTYIGLATLSSLGVYLGVKVKDAIAKPTLVMPNNNNNNQ